MVFTICLLCAVALTLASWYFWLRGETGGPRWRHNATVYGLVIGTAAVLLLVVFLLRPPPHFPLTHSESGVSSVLGWARAGSFLACLGFLVSVFGRGKVRLFVVLAMGLILVFWFGSLMLV